MNADLPLSARQISSIAESDQRINLWHGSIRSGKTIASLLRWLIYVAKDAPGHGEVVMIGKTLQTIERNVINPLQDETLFGTLAAQTSHTTGASTARILGRTVHLIGANDAKSEGKLRGLTCAGAYVDEATLLPEAFWVQLLGRCSVPGAKVFATTNPDNPLHWLRRKFLQNDKLRMASFHLTLDDNPSLDPDYVGSLRQEFTGLWYRRFILGEWVAAEGAIFDMFDPDPGAGHVVHTDDLPPILQWAVAVDYGTTNPFVALLLGLGDDDRIYVVSEWRWDSKVERRQMTDAEYSTGMRQWLRDVGTARDTWIVPEYVFVDPSAASFIVQLWADGWDGVHGATNTVDDGIRSVATLMAAGRLRVHDTCTGLIEETVSYVWDPKASEKGKDAPLKVADHGPDALRYGVMGTWRWWRHLVTIPAEVNQAA